jgi:hypothetical protein
MHIVTPFVTTYSDPTSMGEHVWVMVCITWSNLVVVMDCDNNFIAIMVFTNSVVTSLGRQRMHVL